MERRLIDANALTEAVEEIDWYHTSKFRGLVAGANPATNTPLYKADDIYQAIADAPTIDAVEVVRCCDCLHCIPLQQYADAEVIFYCKKKRPAVVDPTDFCSHGERREGE